MAPLHIAVIKKNSKIINLLLIHEKTDINAVDEI